MSEGHNGAAGAELRQFVERIEHIEEEVKDLNRDKSDIFKEAKSSGYDVPALKEVIRKRAQDPGKRSAHESMVDLYRSALGV